MNESDEYRKGWDAALEMVAKKQDEFAAHCSQKAAEFLETMRLQASNEAKQKASEARMWAGTCRTHKFEFTSSIMHPFR